MTLDGFIKMMFGDSTQHPVFIASLSNVKGDGPVRQVLTRNLADITKFAKKWVIAGRGLFFCVSTLKPSSTQRNKANTSELVGLFTDIDFKQIDCSPDEALKRILDLSIMPPTVVLKSGHGLHNYWAFREGQQTADSKDRLEAALRQVADVFGGDLQCAEVSRLMRLPGSHNTKEGGWVEVEIVRVLENQRYDLPELEESLSLLPPLIRRVGQEGVTPDVNPYLAHAQAHGFKPPIDVEKRLRAMTYGGAGETSVHLTQLSCAASMLSRGIGIEEVVSVLLDATRAAAGRQGERWDWAKEEKKIREMCQTWIEKHPREERKVEVSEGQLAATEAVQGNTVVDLNTKRRARAEKEDPSTDRRARAEEEKTNGKSSSATADHIIVGEAVLGVLRDQGTQLLVTIDGLWRYQDGLWQNLPNDRQWLDGEIERAIRGIGKLKSTIKLVSETRAWIYRHPDIVCSDVKWDGHGGIPTQNGILRIGTGQLEPLRPDHHATWRIECPYLPQGAFCPHWLQILDDFFSDRPDPARAEIIGLVQEIFGCALVEDKSRALTRALVLQGPSESGKSQVIEVLSRMISESPVMVSLDTLNSTHGLMPFMRRAPWVLHEAFEQSQWHLSSIVKTILTGEPVQINIKNGPIITKRITMPTFWGTNHPPSFKEMSKAMVNRLQIIKCGVVFDHNKPIGVAKEAYANGFSNPSEFILAKERSGILNWGIEGLKRALKRGYLASVVDVEKAMEEFRDESNFVTGFIKDHCEYDDKVMITTSDFCAAFAVWWQEEHGENKGVPSNKSIGRAMSALSDPLVAIDHDNLRQAGHRYYAGIRLSDSGLDYWLGAAGDNLAKGKSARMSRTRDKVIKPVPEGWLYKPAIIRMRRAAAGRREP